MNDNKNINNSIGGNNYGLNFTPSSSYSTVETIKTSVPYATSQANNFSNQVDEMDLNLTSDIDTIDNSTSEWLTSSEKFLEQLRTENKGEIEALQREIDNFEGKCQEYLLTLHLDLEREEKIKELEKQINKLQMHLNASPYAIGAESQITNLKNQLLELQKEDKEEKLQYIQEHPDEFKLFMGMSFEEYNQKIEYNKLAIRELQAKDYQLRQLAKEMPYIGIMESEDFKNYKLNYKIDELNNATAVLSAMQLTDYLTEEQIVMFNYLYEKKGMKEAHAYLDAIEDKINQAKGMAEAQVFLSSITDENGNVDVNSLDYTLKTMGKGLWNGIENFGEGFENFFDVNSDGMITDNQYAQQFILQGLSELQKNGQLPNYIDDTYQISTSIGNMLPGSIISILTGGTFGQVLMGISAAGNTKNQALVYTSDNKTLAYIYGALNGASEAAIGKMMGNIPGLNETAKFAAKEILSEGAEEVVQTFADAGFKALVYGETPNFGELSEEALQSFLYGCITSGLMTGGQTAISFSVSGVKYSYNSISELMNAYSAGKITSSANNANVEKVNSVNDTTQNPVSINDEITSSTNNANVEKVNSVNDTPQNQVSNNDKMNRYFELLEIMESEEYQDWDYDNYGAGSLLTPVDTSSEFYHIKQEVDALKREFDQIVRREKANSKEKLSSSNLENDMQVISDNKRYSSPIDSGSNLNNINDSISIQAISLANHRTASGITQTFRFSDASHIPSINSNFWSSFNNPEFIQIRVDGKFMTLKEAFSYKMNLENQQVRDGVESRNLGNTYNSYKKQILDGIIAMDMKYSDNQNIGFRSLKNYLETGNIDRISSAGGYRQTVLSMSRDLLIRVYNDLNTQRQSNVPKKNALESDLMAIIQKHNNKYDAGKLDYNAEFALLKFINPNDSNYGNYNIISSNEGGRSILKKYTPAQIATGLSNLGYYTGNVPVDNSLHRLENNDFKKMAEWYDTISSSKYGVDQGAIEDLCVYILDGKQYNYRQARHIVNEAVKNRMPIPKFSKCGTPEYMRLKDKLVNIGFSKDAASIILSSVNDAGACTYACLANEIFYSFRNNIELFEKTFGYSFYKNGDKNSGVNDTELLLDLYLFANDVRNGGKLISENKLIGKGAVIDVFGRTILDAKDQIYMGNSFGKNKRVIDSFIKSKNSNFSYDSTRLVSNHLGMSYNDYQFNELKEKLKQYIAKGYTVGLGYYYNPRFNNKIIRMNNIDGRAQSCTTASWNEGGGHDVAITGMTEEGFIVSSWGAKFVIPFEDLKNGGRFEIDISKINLT